MSSEPRGRRILLRVFATVLVLLSAAFTGLYGLYAWNLSRNGAETDAVVVELMTERRQTKLIIELTTETGLTVRTNLVDRTGDHEVGDELRVRYLLSDPRTARYAGEPVVQPAPLAVGGTILVLSLGLAIYAWRSTPAKRDRQDRVA